jgi:hypothetical protein
MTKKLPKQFNKNNYKKLFDHLTNLFYKRENYKKSVLIDESDLNKSIENLNSELNKNLEIYSTYNLYLDNIKSQYFYKKEQTSPDTQTIEENKKRITKRTSVFDINKRKSQIKRISDKKNMINRKFSTFQKINNKIEVKMLEATYKELVNYEIIILENEDELKERKNWTFIFSLGENGIVNVEFNKFIKKEKITSKILLELDKLLDYALTENEIVLEEINFSLHKVLTSISKWFFLK